ncbi:MAG: hypothetical protein K0R99_1199 [Microbacterium sp.]|nr:hypothetical protein [Microbacterium sp.]
MTLPGSHEQGEFAPPPPPAPPAAPAPPAQVHPAPAAPAPYPAPGYPAPAYPGPSQPGAAVPPGYPAPGYPGTGYPSQTYPAPGYPGQFQPPVVPARGLLPWALGFLVFIPFPFIGGLASGIAMAVSGGSARRAGGPAAENARSASNWGLTYLMVSTVLLVMHFVLLITLASQGNASTGFFPLGIPITLYFAVSLLHVVLVIIGTVRVSSGGVMRVPFAIPFLRA